jgi:Fe2+ transport system protein B
LTSTEDGRSGDDQPALSHTDVRELVEVQSREHSVKLKELDVRQQELNFQAAHAAEALKAQAQDRREIRDHLRRVERTKLVFVIILVALMLVFSAWAMYVGKDAIVMDLVKVLLGFVGGLGVGSMNKQIVRKKEDKE